MRIAFFGGTFDPIHRGHLRIAAEAADAFALDRVLFAPVGDQPLKAEGSVASFADRLEMVRLAIADDGDARFQASTLDAPRTDGQPNYTVDTLGRLAADEPGAELFMLIGADSFLDLRRWRSPDRLLELAEWIVVSRPEFPVAEGELAQVVPAAEERRRVHLLAGVDEDVSATELRRRLAEGDPCAGLLPRPVAEYIGSHRLYR